MGGDKELVQLAELLRLGAETARQIAGIRDLDGPDVCRLADRADDIADDIIALVDLSWKMARLPQG